MIAYIIILIRICENMKSLTFNTICKYDIKNVCKYDQNCLQMSHLAGIPDAGIPGFP